MRQGALITEVNRRPVHSLKELRKGLAKVSSGKHVLFLVRLGQFTQFLALKMP